MEGTESTHNTKVSDSAYSNSCSNSQSQRSGSSKSRHSGSHSSGSSGYGGKPSETGSEVPHDSKKSKDKDRKKKKLKCNIQVLAPSTSTSNDIQSVSKELTAETSIGICQPESPKETSGEAANDIQCDILVAKTEPNLTSIQNEMLIPTVDEKNKSLNTLSDETATQGTMVVADQSKLEKPQPDNVIVFVISMHDGVVLFTTSSITNSLGYPRDMWLGRSFIDFVHPSHRTTFATQIGMAIGDTKNSNHKEIRNSLYVLLRKYRGLKTTGFAVRSKAITYDPYRLTITFKEAPEEQRINPEEVPSANNTMLLVVSAIPVKSIYKVENEIMCSKPHKFFSRHTYTGQINHVESAVVAVSGFLPQDMLGKLIFDFYHPDDMPFLKEIYETIMREAHKTGCSFHSKPYRFLIQNGSYITIETEWISFINPWSKKLEFVIGHHRVLKGPSNINVFAERCKEPFRSEEVLKTNRIIQEGILRLLETPISRPSADTVKQVISKRCQALASFMETLLGEVNRNDLQLEIQLESDITFSERDSVMLGEISPHHDYFDSKSSSETPPSYNQLNYNENLQRFFDSRPVTTNLEEAMKIESTDGERIDARTNISPIQGFGESESGGNLSSGSNVQMESITKTSNTGSGSGSGIFQPPMLTQELLCKHNEDMEKTMIKQHKVLRSSGRNAEKVKKAPDKTQHDLGMNHGVKRSGSQSWEGEAHKTSKHDHFPEVRKDITQEISPGNMDSKNNSENCAWNVDLWPPFSVSLTTFHNSTPSNYLAAPNIPPALYYIPTQQQNQSIESGVANARYSAVQYIPGIIYPPFNSTQSHIMYQPTMVYQPTSFQPIAASTSSQKTCAINLSTAATEMLLVPPCSQNNNITLSRSQTQNQVQRPPSQATSVKAEPGSNMGSIASASIINRALSESPKKLINSPLTDSTENNKDDDKNLNRDDTNGSSDNMIESSNSSFYSSFLKTEGSSGEERHDVDKRMDLAVKENINQKKRLPDPFWLDGICITSDLIYRYQISEKTITEVLHSDMALLKGINQPGLVNDQLDQLYLDLELEGLSAKLSIGDTTSGSSSGEEENPLKLSNKRFKYGSIVMIYEENSPLPPANY